MDATAAAGVLGRLLNAVLADPLVAGAITSQLEPFWMSWMAVINPGPMKRQSHLRRNIYRLLKLLGRPPPHPHASLARNSIPDNQSSSSHIRTKMSGT
jgi:hypothetical protein